MKSKSKTVPARSKKNVQRLKFKKKQKHHRPVFLKHTKRPPTDVEVYSDDELMQMLKDDSDASDTETRLPSIPAVPAFYRPVPENVKSVPVSNNKQQTAIAQQPTHVNSTHSPATVNKQKINLQQAAMKTNASRMISKQENASVEKRSVCPSKDTALKEETFSDTLENLLIESIRRLDELHSRSVYIRPVPVHCSLELIQELAPEATSIRAFVNKEADKSFAFLEFNNPEVRAKYVELLNGTMFGGSKLVALPATERHKPLAVHEAKLDTLLISCIPIRTQKSDIKQLFRKATRIQLLRNEKNECVGSAKVTFASVDAAKEAFLNNHNKLIRGKRFCVTFCHKRGNKNDSLKVGSLDELCQRAASKN